MSTITTHVLDTALGRPATSLSVALERLAADGRSTQIGAGMTDDDGRVRDLLAPGQVLDPGTYRLRFETGPYFARDGRDAFYPVVQVTFRVAAGGGHYHVPLLLNPFGYSTYRGS
ncbi:MAG: hydroxyisourate hydrolase [Gemmatimonadetes bacterium]|jgi:5-hydroxyisourate hydrolase|nr:hydroxyisourate hydrolase [Gemmatimonadota bacterium]